MKWEPNVVGYPISVLPKQAATPMTEGVPVNQAHSVKVGTNIMDLSDNIMLAHYQRERR